jgi:hypothetical protein
MSQTLRKLQDALAIDVVGQTHIDPKFVSANLALQARITHYIGLDGVR